MELVAQEIVCMRNTDTLVSCRKMGIKAPRCLDHTGTWRCNGEKVNFPTSGIWH